jgi:plasmid stabilization system protein ParE
VAIIRYAEEVLDDYDRILDHLLRHGVEDGLERVAGIRAGIAVLASNPLIGRRLTSGLRELVIGRRSRGYLALYRYSDALDLVTIIAIRAQKEAGYHRP